MRPGKLVYTVLGSALLLTGCSSTTGEEPPASSSAPPVATTTSTRTTPTTIGSTTTTSLGSASSACDLATPEMVEMAYGGEVDEGIEGYADNCTYWLEGAEVAVTKVDVFDLGAADGWDDLVDKQIADWGEVIEVEGVGQDAFHPTYHEGRDLFFRTDDNIYSIISFGGIEGESLDRVTAAVLSLATAIIERNG